MITVATGLFLLASLVLVTIQYLENNRLNGSSDAIQQYGFRRFWTSLRFRLIIVWLVVFTGGCVIGTTMGGAVAPVAILPWVPLLLTLAVMLVVASLSGLAYTIFLNLVSPRESDPF